MSSALKEFLLAELLEHPVLGVQIESEGIERRSLDLVVDAVTGQRRFAEAEHDELPSGAQTRLDTAVLP